MGREHNDRVAAELDNARHGTDSARMRCPFCADGGHFDKKHSLSVSTVTGLWHCFRCDLSGKLPGYTDPEDDYRPRAEAVETQNFIDVPEEFVRLSSSRSYALEPARKYLRSRRIPEKVWEKADLHACAEGFWGERIIIPHKDPDGAWYGWISRLWRDKPLPNAQGLAALTYLYPRGMDRGATFYNYRALTLSRKRPLMLVEGAFDCMHFWNDAVGMLGDLSEAQYEILLTQCERPVCVVQDGDAWEKGMVLAAKLRFAGKRAGHVRLPPRADPDEVDREWLLTEVRASLERPIFR